MSASEWRTNSRPAIGFGSNGEQIARAAALQITLNLDAQCDLQETQWYTRDQDWAAAMKIPFKPTRVNRPGKESIYLGAQPSLVAGENARFDKWPAITVRAGIRSPNDREQSDQFDAYDVALIVEILAMAGPFSVDPLDDRSASDQVDRQYQRLADAVVGCIDQDRSLAANALDIRLPPRMTPSLPWVRRETRKATGGFLVFQAMELVWTVSAFSRVPGL